ncbi:cytochrome c biogenesis CcdA family protein [Mesorhizobium sp. ZMM04-5]|uniref:Cytochrome c biogenesis CcdA family protein n=1 Tax=Mesorhizobium marinum TaxID=3228790 RepID=A0ABV3R602_9HYPH
MQLVFGYLAGLLTLINPCILPVLPIAVASASSSSRWGPVALAAGMALTFTLFGVATASVGPAIGLTPDVVSRVSAAMMVLFGFVLLVPRAGDAFATAAAGIASTASARLGAVDEGWLGGQVLGGMLLGAVWSPCIGPTLGGAISLASQGASLAWAAAIMLAFSLGVATVFLAIAYGARGALRTNMAGLRAVAAWSKPLMGAVFVAVGLALFFGLNHVIEQAVLDAMPIWLQDLSVRL